MLKKLLYFIFLLEILFPTLIKAQDISLFTQINGRYDFTFIGNTLNPSENTNFSPTFLYTQSSANLSLTSNDRIERAYLYWAGSGPGAVTGAVTGAGFAAGAATTAVGLTFGANNSRIRASLGGTPALPPSSCSALL